MTTTFVVALGLTLAAIAAVVFTGVARLRAWHYRALVVMFGLLGWAIYEAETMGKVLVYEGLSGSLRTMHFVAVTAVTVYVPFLVASGVRLHRSGTKEHRDGHRGMALLFIVLVVITAGLGTGMTLTARHHDDPAETEAKPPSPAPADPAPQD